MTRVLVVDYGLGNLHSVIKALREVGGDVEVSADPGILARAGHAVLPGVGAFPDGVHELRARGLFDALLEHAAADRPLLGICLGMQLLLARSEEFGLHDGLGIIPGSCVRIPHSPGVKVPHIGWNQLRLARPNGQFRAILGERDERPTGYFVHSYNAVPEDESHLLASAEHGPIRICAAVHRRTVLGCQFHPEKSGAFGLRLLDHFLHRFERGPE